MLTRFGKPSAPLLDARTHLLTVEGNRAQVDRGDRIYDCYRKQPRRTACKVCATPLGGTPLLRKFDISYFQCATCTHLNGEFEDTAAFNELLYTSSGAGITAADYREETRQAFERRVDDIYLPKAQFLFDALREAGEDPAALDHAELGSGAGYFVSALRKAGAKRARGWDVSQMLIDLGNRMLGERLLDLHGLDELEHVAATAACDVVSMIFVLEHVQDPARLMRCLAGNRNIRYLLVAVPTVSPSMFIELAFPGVFERHLSAHTHLFSDGSLDYLTRNTGFERIAEWWFGGDAMDLLRSVTVRMRQDGHGEATIAGWLTMMRPLVDEWQLALDQRRLASEVHVVLRRTSR